VVFDFSLRLEEIYLELVRDLKSKSHKTERQRASVKLIALSPKILGTTLFHKTITGNASKTVIPTEITTAIIPAKIAIITLSKSMMFSPKKDRIHPRI
jgi:hypothetical protein